MHQKIRSLNVVFIVLDTKFTKMWPEFSWAGYYFILYFMLGSMRKIDENKEPVREKGELQLIFLGKWFIEINFKFQV